MDEVEPLFPPCSSLQRRTLALADSYSRRRMSRADWRARTWEMMKMMLGFPCIKIWENSTDLRLKLCDLPRLLHPLLHGGLCAPLRPPQLLPGVLQRLPQPRRPLVRLRHPRVRLSHHRLQAGRSGLLLPGGGGEVRPQPGLGLLQRSDVVFLEREREKII